MPLGDVSYHNAALDGVVASFPAGTYRLFTGDPTNGGTELAATGGYAPATAPAGGTDFAPASDWTVTTPVPVSFGTSTGEYSDVATYWARVDGLGIVVYYDTLPDPIEVSAASTAVSFTPTLFFRNDF